MIEKIKVIAFDADDTLWVNEPYFQATEHQFCQFLSEFMDEKTLSKELLKVEIANIPIYGYGIKGFMLSMVETALKVSEGKVSIEVMEKIITLGKAMLHEPIELLDGVEKTLQTLHGKYRLVVATKGDLLDQERKLERSGLGRYFHHIEIMSEKRERDYLKLMAHLDIRPSEFLMIGNSVKSDILPVLNIGGHGFHVPYHTTWALETVEKEVFHENFKKFDKIEEVLKLF